MKNIVNYYKTIANFGVTESLSERATLRIRIINQIILLCVIFSVISGTIHLFLGNYLLTSLSVACIINYSINLYFSYKNKQNLVEQHIILSSVMLLVVAAFIIGTSAPFYIYVFPSLSGLFYLFGDKSLPKITLIFVLVALLLIFYLGFDFSNFSQYDSFSLTFVVSGFIIQFAFIWAFLQESKRNRKVIEKQRNFLNEAQNIANIGSWEYTYETQEVKQSKHLLSMFNSPSKGFSIEGNFLSLLPKDKSAIIKNALTDRQDPSGFKLEFKVGSDEEKKWYRIIGRKLMSHDGIAEKLIGTVQEVTEQVKKDKQIAFLYSSTKATLESTTDGILVVNLRGEAKQINKRFTEIWKIPEHLIEGKNGAETLLHILNQVVDKKEFSRKITEIYAQKTITSFDTFKLVDGRIIERYSQPQKIRDKIVGRVWSFRDVTEQKKAQEALEKSEYRYRTIFDNAFHGIIIFDISTLKQIECNQKLLDYFDVKQKDKEQFLQDNLSKYAPPRQPNGQTFIEFLMEKRKIALKEGRVTYEFEHSKRSMKSFFTEVTWIKLSLEGEGIYCAIYKDITQQKLQQQSIKEQADYLKMIIDLNPCLIYSKNRAGVFLLANKAMAKLYNTTPEELIGRNEHAFNSNYEEVDHSMEMDRVVIQSKEAMYIPYEEITDANNNTHWLQTTKTPILDENGICNEIFGVSTFISDRVNTEQALLKNETEIKALLQQVRTKNQELENQSYILSQANSSLKRSNQDLEQFAYIASHDLQEPLRMVGNFVQLLEMDYHDKLNEEGKMYINYVVDGVTRMSKLIDDLLEYSRVGRKEMKLEATDIKTLVKTKLIDLKVRIEEKNAKVKFSHIPKDVICEPNLLSIVFFNIIGNALKFNTDPNPLVIIEATETKRSWTFSIKDNGIGIAPKNQKKIFEIFKRLHRKENYEGTGIGLALCKRIINRHKGKIWLESELDKGTTFFFTIPKNLAAFK